VFQFPLSNRGVNPIMELHSLVRLFFLYRRIRPRVALHFTIKPVAYGSFCARLLDTTVINTVTGLGTAFLSGNLLRRVATILLRVSTKKANYFIFQNEDDKALFEEIQVTKKSESTITFGAGIDLETFQYSPKSDLGKFKFLFLGRLISDKGIRDLVEAARSLRKIDDDFVVSLVGTIDITNRSAISHNELASWIDDGLVEYQPHVHDVRPLIKESDCVVLPSYREGLARCLIEAAAIGRPVIASDVPGCREIVVDKCNGLLCRPRDPADLMAKMLDMKAFSEEERKKMGRFGRELVEEKFGEEAVNEIYLDTIKDCLSGARFSVR